MTPDRSQFGPDTPADEVLVGMNLTGKTALITGGSSGIGVETTRSLAKAGAQVILTARNVAKGEAVAADIRQSTGNAQVEVMSVELASLADIRRFAQAFHQQYDKLDILINNAGVMACPFGKTAEGFERQFGTNHLGHFLLTILLVPALKKGEQARIVNVSSRAHRMSPVVFGDIMFEQREYQKWPAYGQSKTANILHAVELNRRLKKHGIEAFSVHPGVIMTELTRHMSAKEIQGLAHLTLKTVQAGAATSVYAATAPELTDQGGAYLYDCQVAEVYPGGDDLDYVWPYAIDGEAAQQLWTLSEKWVGEQSED